MLHEGILNADDSTLAADRDADGVVVSNYGGRQLEDDMSAVQVLPEIASTAGRQDGRDTRRRDSSRSQRRADTHTRRNRLHVRMRRFYGLTAGRKPGVERVLDILRDEIDVTFSLLGRPTLADIDRRILQG